MPIEEVVSRIVRLNKGISDFWKSAQGWAPIEAAALLSRSRLDWQVSLSACLSMWFQKGCPQEGDGRLILAWVNLGSLVEGTLKWFLSVYYDDYRKDVDAIRKKNKLVDPDTLTLEHLRTFFVKKVWDNDDFGPWIQKIQMRRNTIHAYKDRKIGTFTEFEADVRSYLAFLRALEFRVPYTDDVMCPSEEENMWLDA